MLNTSQTPERVMFGFITIFISALFLSSCGGMGAGGLDPSEYNRLTRSAVASGVKTEMGVDHPADKTSSFTTEDKEVVSLMEFINLKGGHHVRWEWIKPDGSVYLSTKEYPVKVDSGRYYRDASIWHKISLNGEKAENFPGRWKVNIYVDGSLERTDFFTLKDNRPGRLFVNVKPDDAEIRLPDSNLSYTPGMAVKPGKYRIQASAPGFETQTKEIRIAAGEKAAADLSLAKVPVVSPKTPQIAMIPDDIEFGDYKALVIGNNEYEHLPELSSAVNDAKTIAELLKDKYGFTEVELLLNATRADLVLKLNEYRKTLNKSDNLLIYYAGHGWLDKDADEGYWLPVNAERNNNLNWISNSTITAELKAMEAKHILVIADSCYSGKLARSVRLALKTPSYLERIASRRARTVLCSGGLEPVVDQGGKKGHSVFASAFIDALLENNGIIDGTELFTKIRRPVMLNADQSPEYSDIRRAGHEGGDFLFIRKQ